MLALLAAPRKRTILSLFSTQVEALRVNVTAHGVMKLHSDQFSPRTSACWMTVCTACFCLSGG